MSQTMNSQKTYCARYAVDSTMQTNMHPGCLLNAGIRSVKNVSKILFKIAKIARIVQTAKMTMKKLNLSKLMLK